MRNDDIRKRLWSVRREKDEFVKRVVEEIIRENQHLHPMYGVIYESDYRSEIESEVYKILNRKVKTNYPMNIRAVYSKELKDNIKMEFFKSH